MQKKETLMKEVYKFHESKNAEILFRFNLIVLECDDDGQYESVKKMLSSVGRMKFVRPTFRALIKNEGRKKMADEIYGANCNFYHPICAKMVGQDLKEQTKQKPANKHICEPIEDTQVVAQNNIDINAKIKQLQAE